MKISDSNSRVIDELWSGLEPEVERAKTLEEAAQIVVADIHAKFSESVVLARAFFTVPFLSLPLESVEFVQSLAESAGGGSDLKPTTPVLSLVGTQGQEAAWNDRRKSEGHTGIPLVSSAFVDAIPMISRLLKELGVPMHWIDSHDSEIIQNTVGHSSGLFYVNDAEEATDQAGRKIIAAQDFVSAYDVKSVFGMGAAYPSGQIIVLVVFCRDDVSRETAEQFLPLIDGFKDKTSDVVGMAKTFRENN